MERRRAEPRDVMRAAFYSLWGVLTIVLIFAVAYLFTRLSDSPDGATPTKAASNQPITNSGGATGETSAIRLYFADPARLRLTAEDRSIPLTGDTRENCRAALTALLEGPTSQLAPVLPPAARVRALYLLEAGELVVDFSRDIDSPSMHSASAEWIATQALAHTLTQPALHGPNEPVTSVRLLYEGSPAEEGFPGHIALPGSVRPDPRLLSE